MGRCIWDSPEKWSSAPGRRREAGPSGSFLGREDPGRMGSAPGPGARGAPVRSLAPIRVEPAPGPARTQLEDLVGSSLYLDSRRCSGETASGMSRLSLDARHGGLVSTRRLVPLKKNTQIPARVNTQIPALA